jgi:hypothetical protein
VHAANENDICPRKVRGLCALDILIDESDLPTLRQIGGDDQQTLRRHERTYARHQLKRMSKSAEGRRVGREDAEDISTILDRNRAVQVNYARTRVRSIRTSWRPTTSAPRSKGSSADLSLEDAAASVSIGVSS